MKISQPGELARVVRVSDDGCTLHLRYSADKFATARSTKPIGIDERAVVIVGEDSLEVVPDDLLVDDHLVGVVRLIKDNAVVIEVGGVLRSFPSKGKKQEISVGNTVEVDSYGIWRVLSTQPIRARDGDEIDEAFIRKFLTNSNDISETFTDFGGLSEVKKRARDLIEVTLQKRELIEKIRARPINGIIFTGESGTGKTMLARIIAKESGAAFYEIRGPEVVSKWVGQSEEILRHIFDHASKQPSAIIFFDEIDSVANQRAEDSHESSRRLVAQLLTLMDGFRTRRNVVVIATTNRIQDIDVALRRPGRFDWEIEFPKPDLEDRLDILSIKSRALETRGDLPIEAIASRTSGWSAAELSAIWNEAARLAAKDGKAFIDAEDLYGGFEIGAKAKGGR